MKILAFDSTAKTASVAVTEDDRLLGLYNIENGLTQSELLLPMAENLMKSLKLTFSDIDAFAAAVGPGSFTGVRIGVSLVKGLAFSKNKPCIAVSTLESIANNLVALPGIIISAMDARRNQIYTATFSSDGKALERKTPDRAISIDSLAEELKNCDTADIYIAGDGYDVLRRGLSERGINVKETPELLISQNAYSCAKAAYKAYANGSVETDITIAPTYLRMPQAERERLEREKEIKQAEI